jgi:hypothetical protein
MKRRRTSFTDSTIFSDAKKKKTIFQTPKGNSARPSSFANSLIASPKQIPKDMFAEAVQRAISLFDSNTGGTTVSPKSHRSHLQVENPLPVTIEANPSLPRSTEPKFLHQTTEDDLTANIDWDTYFSEETYNSPAENKGEPSERECSVCAESFAVKDYPGLMACEHASDVCHGCLLQWIDQQMASTSWEQITCPSNGCKNPITHDDVKTHTPQDVFTR